MFMGFNNPHHDSMFNQSDNVGDHQTHRHGALHDDELVSDSDGADGYEQEEGEEIQQPILSSYMGNIAAACNAANAATQKPFRTNVEKQEERRVANRRSAKMSRDRKKMERDQLQEKATRLAQANLALIKENQELKQEIANLTAHQGGGGGNGFHQKPSHSLSNTMPGGFGGLASNNQQDDLFTLQWMQQQAQMDQQQKKQNAASMSNMTSSLGFSDLMVPAALVQGSQLATQTLQMAASTRNQHQQQSMHHVSDTNALALGLAPGGLSRAFESNKRQKSDSGEFI
jgi:hypothetical protein